MYGKQKRLGPSATVAVLVLTLCLAAAPAGLASPRPPKKPRGIAALIVGHAASPVLEAIRAGRDGRFDVDRADAAPGSAGAPLEDRGRYKVLIVDGDDLSPSKLERLPAVSRFADSGRWVLALDLRHGRFRGSIRKLTGFGGAGHSRVFMFRRISVAGSAQVQMVIAPALLPSGVENLDEKGRRELAGREATRLAAFVHRTIRTDGDDLPAAEVPAAAEAPAAPEAPAGPAGLPAELQHVGWSYTVTGSQFDPDGFWSTTRSFRQPIFTVPNAGNQISSWSMTHNFDVYLDNGQGRPQGNDEIVTYELNGEFSPKQASGKFFQMFNPFEIGFNPHGPVLERAWWTGMIGSSVEPDEATSGKLTWQANEPQTPNEETEYRSGNEFEVGFAGSKEGAEVEASYKVTNEQSQKIPDWGVESETSGNDLDWLFSSRKACDIRPTHYSDSQCFNVGATSDGAPNLPSDLSRGQMQIHTSGRWKTKGLLGPGDGTLNFAVSTPVTLADTYCDQWNLFDFGCVRRELTRKEIGPTTQHYSFDAGAVVPIPIAALKLAPNPADGAKGQEVTGTVVLKRPAAMDTNVIVYSDSPDAVVGGPSGRGSQRTISIPKGSDTGTFKVQTNDNGLKPGDHVTASITAFYAEPTTAQLRIESPAR